MSRNRGLEAVSDDIIISGLMLTIKLFRHRSRRLSLRQRHFPQYRPAALLLFANKCIFVLAFLFASVFKRFLTCFFCHKPTLLNSCLYLRCTTLTIHYQFILYQQQNRCFFCTISLLYLYLFLSLVSLFLFFLFCSSVLLLYSPKKCNSSNSMAYQSHTLHISFYINTAP